MPTTSDRRRSERVEVKLPARVRFPNPSIQAEAMNVSNDGAYFVLNGPLGVEVEVDLGNGKQVLTGRLVRIDSRTAAHDSLSFAIRLDQPVASRKQK